MNPERSSRRSWLAAYAFIAVVVLAGFWIMDGVTAFRAPHAVAETTPGRAVPPGRAPRVFVLLLDSLRYETAISPDFMPTLAGLREQGVWAEVKPSYNAVTVPCLRAAYTGRDEVSVLSFVQNFIHGNAQIDSLFSRLAEAGHRTAAFSNGAFDQFGAAIDPNISKDLSINTEHVESQEEEGVGRMLELFREGRHAVVFAHVSYTDYTAHRHGVGTEGYRRDYRRADRLVAKVSAALGPGDTLVVMGDHGHADDGSHSLGQDVHTFLLYRGPTFKAGGNLGVVPIMAHTWLLGQLFGVALPAGYTGGVYPQALAGVTAEGGSTGKTEAVKTTPVPAALWVYLALLAVFGAGLLWPERAPWMRASGARWLVWLALPPALAPLPWNGWMGAPVALAVLVWLMRGAGGRAWGWAAAAVAAGLAWHGWGCLLAEWREGWHAITRGQLAAIWLAVGALTVACATRRNRGWPVFAAGAAAFLTFPTNYGYGFTAMMVPLLWLWLAGLIASLVREGRLRTAADAGWALASTAAIFGFTQMFVGVEASRYVFRHFVPLLDYSPTGFETLMAAGLLAKLVIFYPAWPRRWGPALVAALFIGGLQHLHWRLWEPGPWGGLLIAGGLLGGWLGLRRRDPELAQVFLLGLLFYLYAYFVRPYRESYDRAACVLAALTLAARWLRRFPQPENTRMDYTVLGVIAVLATGYFTVSWSIEHLEWSRIYFWVPAHLAETALVAVILVPWIVLKTSIPLFIARVLLARELAGHADWPGGPLRRLVGFKVLTLLLVVSGLGLGGLLNNVYLEGVQQLAVLGILSIGLLFGFRTPAPSAGG